MHLAAPIGCVTPPDLASARLVPSHSRPSHPPVSQLWLIFFYLLAAILCISLGLCLFVASCFKRGSFPAVWPVKLLRAIVSIVFSARSLEPPDLRRPSLHQRPRASPLSERPPIPFHQVLFVASLDVFLGAHASPLPSPSTPTRPRLPPPRLRRLSPLLTAPRPCPAVGVACIPSPWSGDGCVLYNFPDTQWLSSGHVGHGIVAALMCVQITAISFLISVAESEQNLLAPELLASFDSAFTIRCASGARLPMERISHVRQANPCCSERLR